MRFSLTPCSGSYWQSGNYVWNNTGDTATLRNPLNAVVDTCRWTRIGTGATTC